MAFEEVKEQLAEADAGLKTYIEQTSDYYQLKGFKFLMQGITSFSKVLMVAAFGLMALFFLSLAASFTIGNWLHNTSYGFICVGLFYVVAGMVAYIARHKLDKPLLRKFSEYYFEES